MKKLILTFLLFSSIALSQDLYVLDSTGHYIPYLKTELIGPASTIPGPMGADGYTPRKGIDYNDGEQGLQGERGYTPIKGVDYFDGAASTVPGPAGYTPIKGVDYFDGEDGGQGIQGEASTVAGPQGIPGSASTVPGPKGDSGYTPRKGIDYNDGEAGPQGERGLPGVKGDTGDSGATGPQGLSGLQGEQGPQGNTGAASTVPGPQGPKGDTGDAGLQGIQGIQGIPGVDGSGTGYSINVQALTSSPTDAQTVYFGVLPKAPTTTANISKVYIPKTGTIKRAEIYCYSGTAGTNESWSLYVRLNNTTDYLIATKNVATSERIFSNASLSIAVTAGQYIEIKGIQPTWVTNPLTCIYGGYIYIE